MIKGFQVPVFIKGVHVPKRVFIVVRHRACDCFYGNFLLVKAVEMLRMQKHPILNCPVHYLLIFETIAPVIIVPSSEEYYIFLVREYSFDIIE